MSNLQDVSETPTKPGPGTKNISNIERLYGSETWYPAYREFMDAMLVLAEKEEEKAPVKGLTFDLFESELL